MSDKKMSPSFLAFDLGAESGRAVVGSLDSSGRLKLEDVHRFSNGPVRVNGSLHWDVLRLWSEIQTGLSLAARDYGTSLVSLGIDTWGVDFGLLARDDSLLGNPYHYRDNRTNGMLEEAYKRVPRAEIYEATGIQFMQLNTLYQLLSMVVSQSPMLDKAETFLNMPDLLGFWLTGRKVSEFSIATTTQCYDPRAGNWAWDLLKKMGIPTHIFKEIVPTGTMIGKLRQDVAEDNNSPVISVIAPATHDTGSAVAAVPAVGSDYIYLSSGTWSLMGVEVKSPIITPESLALDITNEGGVNNTIRFLKNIMGLWLVQECRRQWQKEGAVYSYDELTAMAASAPAFGPVIPAGDSRFMAPGDMPARIQAFCKASGQKVPQSKAEILRCAQESLALEYRQVAESMEKMVGRRLPVIHIIGGGSRNKLLNQFTANATGRKVVAGPVEATAIGNILTQAMAMGYIASLEEGRKMVSRSFEMSEFQPVEPAGWDKAYETYIKIKANVG